ncbi:MAG: DUF177 domain-containing protein [Defluviitaleaceae bacterium]|nr:DUF177 domain-containing protein [Defluviitaleaceae bacterium]
MMIIDVKSLRVGVPQDFECVSLRSLPESYGATSPCPSRIHGRVTKVDTGAVVCEGELTAKLRFECGRCLDAVEHELSMGFQEKIELAAHDDVIDISSLVDENIILNIPQKVLCGEECKGLCPVCGASLNLRDCGCERGGDSKFAALKNLLQSEGGERDGNLPKR